MSAIDGHKVEDFDLQKLAPAGSKAYKELWPAGNTRLTWLVIQKSCHVLQGHLSSPFYWEGQDKEQTLPASHLCKWFDIVAESHSRRKKDGNRIVQIHVSSAWTALQYQVLEMLEWYCSITCQPEVQTVRITGKDKEAGINRKMGQSNMYCPSHSVHL